MKNKVLIIGLVILCLLIFLVTSIIGTYNKLQIMDEQVTSNWAQVENQLKRRNDLIPNLVNTVKGYAKHESQVFSTIAEARSKLAGAIDDGDMKAIQQNNNELDSALSRLLVVVENYPTLKADKSFTGLQDELAGTENRIAVARRDYNESVKDINTIIRTFPTSIIASIVKVEKREYFEVPETEKATPKVEF